jgi:hypothetical protein
MARLLFTVWPYPTHSASLYGVGAGSPCARARGGLLHRRRRAAVLAREGFRCFPFREVDWDRVARTVDDLIAGRKRPVADAAAVAQVPGGNRARAGSRPAGRAGAWPADALVCDIAMWAPILILRERTGIPIIAFSHVAHCILPGPGWPDSGDCPAPPPPHLDRSLRRAGCARRQTGHGAHAQAS